MSGPPRINDTVHNQLDMEWSNSLGEKKKPWKTMLSFVIILAVILLAMPSVWPPPVNLPSQTRWMNTKDWFHTRKKYTVPLVLLAMLLVMAFLTIGVPYLLSIQQGDVSQAQVSVSLGGGFPQEHQVQAGMEQIKDTFQANFHNCQLLELHFDAVYSGGLQEELQERYGTEETKGLFVVTSTVVTGRLSPPEGMSPATTYDDVQWILADTGNGLITVLDWGRFLVDRR